jgi:large conductance mechanosensitive channel
VRTSPSTVGIVVTPVSGNDLRIVRPTEKGGVMLKEFRDFLLRGNIVELAVAFVMGVAFAAVVNSLVNNLVMPIVAMIIGKPNFNDLTFTINDAVFRYGAFITDVISFLAIAAAVFFFVVKPMNMIMARVSKPTEEEISDEERRHQELLAALRAR